MTVTRYSRWWVLGNLIWLLAVPLLFGIWLSAEVDAQYASGIRTTGSGDSMSLPLAAVALTNGVLLLALDAAISLYLLFRRAIAPRGPRQPMD